MKIKLIRILILLLMCAAPVQAMPTNMQKSLSGDIFVNGDYSLDCGTVQDSWQVTANNGSITIDGYYSTLWGAWGFVVPNGTNATLQATDEIVIKGESTICEGSEFVAKIYVHNARHITGRVLNGVDPVANATVRITGQSDNGQAIDVTTTTDAAGNYSFDIPDGDYTIVVVGYDSQVSVAVDGQDVEVTEFQQSANLVYYHYDLQGSTIAQTDTGGYVIFRANYFPYGDEHIVTNSNALDYHTGVAEGHLFSGKELDVSTNLSYFGARYYSNYHRRFTSIDPAGPDAMDPQTFNRYAYCLNNPYKYVDPDGEWAESALDIAFLAYDINQIRKEGFTVENSLALAGDALGLALPFATGIGAGIRVVGKADDVVDISRQTTVLGENMMERVIPYADKTGARTLPFGTTPEEWAKLTPKERWKLNDGALRKRINEGDNFKYIGQDVYRDPAVRRQFDLTGSELLRLNERGIPYETVSPSDVKQVLGRP